MCPSFCQLAYHDFSYRGVVIKSFVYTAVDPYHWIELNSCSRINCVSVSSLLLQLSVRKWMLLVWVAVNIWVYKGGMYHIRWNFESSKLFNVMKGPITASLSINSFFLWKFLHKILPARGKGSRAQWIAYLLLDPGYLGSNHGSRIFLSNNK